jgi:hypothetical protein
MSIQEKIDARLDSLQENLIAGNHLKEATVGEVQDIIESVAKFYSFLAPEDREYLECARIAIDDQMEWNI